MSSLLLVLAAVAGFAVVNGQVVPNTFPHVYPGQPTGDYSPQWQDYFQVKDQLPNVTWDLSRNWAGNIAVNRPNHPNDTLFFWAFEKENGSLTSAANDSNDKPWGIWLNGGPGASSMLGLMLENGPLHVTNTFSIVQNNVSWDILADYIWIDQPVGTGYSTADTNGYIADEDQMGEDFMGFLSNLVKIFPSLASRPLYLTGESYAGTYIPYITKTYFSTPNPPVNLTKIAIGDGAIGSLATFEELPALSVIETYPELISFDPDVYNYFKEQTHLCGFDLNLTYPQTAHFPTLNLTLPTDEDARASYLQRDSKSLSQNAIKSMITSNDVPRTSLSKREADEREARRQVWKRDLTGRANGTIDPHYGCLLFDEMLDYATNFSFPWNQNPGDFNGFDPYDIPDALDPEAPADPSVFLNNNRTRAALHAPTSKDWALQFNYPFGSTYSLNPNSNEFGDPSVEPMAFLSELASNASAHGVAVVIYSGNDDALVGHRGTEVTIQNTTFGGIQGFTRKPSTPWFDDSGNFVGIVHQERNWTYALFNRAGHEVPEFAPTAAFVFARDFILGNNQTGLVTNSSGTITVIGGENSTLAEDILPGGEEIFYGSGTTASTATFATATFAAWESFIATATATPSTSEKQSGAQGLLARWDMCFLTILLSSMWLL